MILIEMVVNWFLVVLFLCTALACGFKLISAIFAAAAFPTYLGLYYAETFIKMFFPNAKRLRLCIPKKSAGKRITMNVCASFCSVSSLGYALAFFTTPLFKGTPEEVTDRLLVTTLIPLPFGILTVLCLFTIFAISYREQVEEEEGTPIDKIEKLEVPELFKKAFGF